MKAMDQINWKNKSLTTWSMVVANLYQFYDESIENPAYPKEKDSPWKKNKPTNVVYESVTLGADTRRRGASGHIEEYLNCLDKDSLQFQLWAAACNLFDSHYSFTVDFNNDAWHDLEDDKDDEAWEAHYEVKHEAIIILEDKILDLCRDIRKRKFNNDVIDYASIRNFITKDYTYDWYDFKSWDEACTELLKNLELYLLALGPNEFLDKYYEKINQKKRDSNVNHFDWRLNPILRDFYFGFIFRNPLLVSNNGKMLKDPFMIMDFLMKNVEKKIYTNIKEKESLINESEPGLQLDANILIKNHFQIFNKNHQYPDYESFEKVIFRLFKR